MPKAAITTEDATKLREWTNKFLATFNGMEDLGEPFLTIFNNVKAQFNGILKDLPMTDAVPASHEASWNLQSLLSCMMGMQSMLSCTGEKMKELRARASQADAAAVEAAVKTAIEAKITAGELVRQDTVTSLCSNAKLEGITEGEQKVRNELQAAADKAKRIADRKTLLTTNSLPLPKDDALLDGTDEEFNARQATAKSRVETLTGKKVALNSPLMADVWASENEFKIIENAVTHLRATETPAAPGKPAEPFNKQPEGVKAPHFIL